VLEPLAPVIATLQAAEGDPMRLAWDLRGDSALLSQLRNIRREIGKLLDAGLARQRATVMLVTSAMPGEGKSFLSLGLARVLAAGQDRRVVLVDADLPKRNLTELLGTSDQPGLVECLADGRAIADVLCRSDDPALSFVPAGRWRPDVPDLMCGTKMDRILKSFQQCDRRHVFVVDTAPILAFGETAHLAEQADLVVLVIRADRTPRAAAEEALRKLAADRPLALVLNGQQGSVLDGYYGYGDSHGDYLPAEEK
jgi:protein-tyrosine kinase